MFRHSLAAVLCAIALLLCIACSLGAATAQSVAAETPSKKEATLPGETAQSAPKNCRLNFEQAVLTTPKKRFFDLDGESIATQEIAKQLELPTEMNHTEIPLSDVVDALKERHDIEIQIDREALDDVGVGTDTPITKKLKGVSLRSALKLTLRELDLTYLIRDEVLLITTPEAAECWLPTRVYPVKDLVVCVNKAGQQWADFDSLIDLITPTIQPTSWEEVGGPGTIVGFEHGRLLVVSQTADVHEEILALLETLRRAIAEQRSVEKPPLREMPAQIPTFHQLDTNRDNNLSPEEFRWGVQNHRNRHGALGGGFF